MPPSGLYRITGDLGGPPSGCLSEIASALYHGPTPVPEAQEGCERLLEEATDRPGRAHVLAYLAGLHAFEERGDDALRLLDEADTIYRDLRDDYSLANTSGRIRGRVHALAEEHEAAQAAFRTCCETFERIDDAAALASVAAELGGSLCAQGRIDEAREWSAVAERRAPAGDVIAQFSWRILKARLLAHDDRPAEAEPLAMEALSLVMQTDALTHQGDVLLDVATVLTAASRPGEAAERVRQAIDVYDRKQNAASARNARARLAAEVVLNARRAPFGALRVVACVSIYGPPPPPRFASDSAAAMLASMMMSCLRITVLPPFLC